MAMVGGAALVAAGAVLVGMAVSKKWESISFNSST